MKPKLWSVTITHMETTKYQKRAITSSEEYTSRRQLHAYVIAPTAIMAADKLMEGRVEPEILCVKHLGVALV